MSRIILLALSIAVGVIIGFLLGRPWRKREYQYARPKKVGEDSQCISVSPCRVLRVRSKASGPIHRMLRSYALPSPVDICYCGSEAHRAHERINMGSYDVRFPSKAGE